MDQMTCLLPGGCVDEAGIVHRQAELTSLSGREEELLVGCGERAPVVTALLSRCVHRIGGISPVSEKVARSLLVADRQYLLLKLREATFGDRVQATASCPWQDCGHRMDVDFSIRDIPVKESADKGPVYRMDLLPGAALIDERGETHRAIAFRLPNGHDEETIAPLLAKDEAAAAATLLRRCIQSIGPFESPKDGWLGRLSPLARIEIERQMETVAPQVELTMELDCPECGREFEMPFDLPGFFLGELGISRDLLYREVHYLAYHYHWSEREIMGLPREKRRRYIAVLAEEMERLNDGI